MPGIPPLTYFPLTKTGNEVWIYYNLDNAYVRHKVTKDGILDVGTCNPGNCADDSWDASVLMTPNTLALAGGIGGIPAYSPLYTAVPGEVVVVEPKVGVDVVCLPAWEKNVLLCYDDSFDETPGTPFRAIPRKFSSADHYVKQRSDSTLRIDDKYVSNWDGLRAISGRQVTIIVVVIPQDSGVISEIIYYSNFLCVPPAMTFGADQNGTIVLSGTGSYSIKAIFSAPKPA